MMASEFRAALGEDLDQLTRLHDRELDGATLAALRVAGFPGCLALLPADAMAARACANFAAALAELADPPSAEVLDELAADYAAIYLNNRLGASPYETVWLDDDHLVCQQAMFELRDIYAAAGLGVADWRQRCDDHLVLQLQYLRHLLAAGAVDGAGMADFIDEHVGYWFPDFARRVAGTCHTPFYAALAELTHVWLLGFRALLGEMYGSPVPPRAEITARINRKLARDKAEVAPLRFMPGAQGPGW
jgi:TorA maturation chaperone TorD